MKTTALRLYGKRDLRLETFDLPEMQEDEILATVVTDSLCLSSWKEANLGENHKKYPTMWRPTPSSSATSFAAIFWPWVKVAAQIPAGSALCDSGQPAIAGSPGLPRLLLPVGGR